MLYGTIAMQLQCMYIVSCCNLESMLCCINSLGLYSNAVVVLVVLLLTVAANLPCAEAGSHKTLIR